MNPLGKPLDSTQNDIDTKEDINQKMSENENLDHDDVQKNKISERDGEMKEKKKSTDNLDSQSIDDSPYNNGPSSMHPLSAGVHVVSPRQIATNDDPIVDHKAVSSEDQRSKSRTNSQMSRSSQRSEFSYAEQKKRLAESNTKGTPRGSYISNHVTLLNQASADGQVVDHKAVSPEDQRIQSPSNSQISESPSFIVEKIPSYHSEASYAEQEKRLAESNTKVTLRGSYISNNTALLNQASEDVQVVTHSNDDFRFITVHNQWKDKEKKILSASSSRQPSNRPTPLDTPKGISQIRLSHDISVTDLKNINERISDPMPTPRECSAVFLESETEREQEEREEERILNERNGNVPNGTLTSECGIQLMDEFRKNCIKVRRDNKLFRSYQNNNDHLIKPFVTRSIFGEPKYSIEQITSQIDITIIIRDRIQLEFENGFENQWNRFNRNQDYGPYQPIPSDIIRPVTPMGIDWL